ncbi:MAG: alpha/beta fold hydrolase [Burkholderiales bacterium]|nr:alpha/beta fold hydrolase [Burkholderiales bacterium]MDE1926567.1 alpha/beta fold hydrolase [Burkholderiales bacterium]MDE2503443.1 alpha/beta fold hydrolase [Burkholderiales bacterium]
MISRLQKAITLSLILVASLWALYWLRHGHAGVAIGGAVGWLLGYTLLLSLEFVLQAHLHGEDPTPRPSPGQRLRAWSGELAAAPRTFCWRQPFRSRVWSDRLPPSAQGKRGLLLIHGFACNRGLWNDWLQRLARQDRAWIALDLEPPLGSIDLYVATIESAVQRLEIATGVAPVVVAHSMGGLAARRWWAGQQEPGRIHHLVTIATPHRGTWLARWALSPNTRQMRCDSSWLQDLATRERQSASSHCTCYYGNCDNIVFPPSRALWPGARAIHLDAVAHVSMTARPEPWIEVQRLLRDPVPIPKQDRRVRSPSSS